MNFMLPLTKLNRLSYTVLCGTAFFVAASILYFILNNLVDKVVGAPLGSVYHWAHPYSFIMVFEVFFMITILLTGNRKAAHSNMFYFIFYVVWIVLSLVFSGLLWSLFDMNAGYFPQGSELFKKIFSDMFYGLTWVVWLF